jgi:hypothetical protein
MSPKIFNILALLVICLLGSINLLYAQEYRANISGQVLDPNEATVPGASVTLTNTETNVAVTTTSNENGLYQFLLVQPGKYQVTAESGNFGKFKRLIEVRVGDNIVLDLKLSVDAIEVNVDVSATNTPLVEAGNATIGQVIDARRISELPLLEGNPMILSRLTPGVANIGDNVSGEASYGGHTEMRRIVLGGTEARSTEFTLNNSPNNQGAIGVRSINIAPVAEAVQEFKVVTNNYDAQSGHGNGSSIDVTLKSGGNQFHGNLYGFVRNDAFNSNSFFNNANGAERQPRRYNRTGATIGGPVYLPRFGEGGPALYNGKDRTFFFFSYERTYNKSSRGVERTVPTLLQRGLGPTGDYDFSELLGAELTSSGNPVYNRNGTRARAGQIYDPYSGRFERWNPATNSVVPSSNIERVPIECNGRINVICANDPHLSQVGIRWINAFFPLPNRPINRDGRNNFFGIMPSLDYMNAQALKIDHSFNSNNRGSFHFAKNYREGFSENWNGVINGIEPNGLREEREGYNVGYDHITNINETTFINIRAGFTIFERVNPSTSAGKFDPASLGYSALTVSQFRGAKYLPNYTFGSNSYNGATGNGLGEITTPYSFSLQPTLFKLIGNHSLKIGYDVRSYYDNASDYRGTVVGFSFDQIYTRRNNTSGADTQTRVGQDLAALLFGLPSTATLNRNISRANNALYHGAFIQDDWKVTSRLTLNLGLRYDYESPTTERYNRGIRGFDPNVTNPVEAQAVRNYLNSTVSSVASDSQILPIHRASLSSFQVKGGFLFADEQNRGFFNADKNNFQPRVGAAFKLTEKTVLRGGWGLFTVPVVLVGADNVSGFSRTNSISPIANSRTDITNAPRIEEPFPFGVPEPYGSSLGLASALGLNNITFQSTDKKNTQVQRWSFGIQHELPGQWLVEANYVGSRTSDAAITRNLNAVPRQYLSASLIRDNAVITSLGRTVSNPFRNISINGVDPFAGSRLTGDTISVEQLLRPFPQFSGDINTQVYDGWSSYHSGQFSVEKRFTQGYTITAGYTWSKLLEKMSFLNPTDTEPEKRLSPFDIPHRFFSSGIFEFPFGKGRRWGSNWDGFSEAIFGGWQVSGTYQYQTGLLAEWGNVYYNGDPTRLKSRISSKDLRQVFDTSGFRRTTASEIELDKNIRYFPTTIPGIRDDSTNIWTLGVMKKYPISENVRLQFRAEAINAFNHPTFDAPIVNPRDTNFGDVRSTLTSFRDVQFGLKLDF